MSESESQNGIFLNGKQQVIELLQAMNGAEKEKLLNNIGLKNAVMAQELREKSFSFASLTHLPDSLLRDIFDRINPIIIGLALYHAPVSFQRKVLSLIERPTAEKSFEILNQDLSSKRLECKRAEEKIISVAIQMSRRHRINL